MRNPIIKDVGGLRMLVLLHAVIPCLAAYIRHLFSYILALSSLFSSTFNRNVLLNLSMFYLIKLENDLIIVRGPDSRG